jgi:hypothetical protein
MNLALPTAHPHPPPDLPMWDRLFGIERNADEFAARCGLPRDNERKLGRMLPFRDVYNE